MPIIYKKQFHICLIDSSVFILAVLFDTLSHSFRTGTGEPDQNRRNRENNKGEWAYGLLEKLEEEKRGEHSIKIP